jgi:uncharacterized protein YqgC (DUF456 family)
MSTSSSSSLAFASQQLVIYIGFFIFIAGIIGGPLVLIVFLSLKTFRQNSSAFYLTVMSFVNTLHLFTGLLTYIMINGFGVSWTNMSLFFCKFRPFSTQLCILMSFTSMCFATIDQFLATASNPRWRQWNNIKLAHYMVMGAVIFYILHGIPFLMYNNHILSSTTGQSTCGITNPIFQKYYTVGFVLVPTNILPMTILILFGVLAYRNVQQIAYRAVPLVRRELDKQLTVMVLVEALCDVIFVTPMFIQTMYSLIIGAPSDPYALMQFRLVMNFTTIWYFFRFVVWINDVEYIILHLCLMKKYFLVSS